MGSGTDTDNVLGNVSDSKDTENAPAEGPEARKPKRRKEKLIRLDDLLPKGDVSGGRQIFGASSDNKPTNQHNQ